MKVVQINATYNIGSTGRICGEISDHLTKLGIENFVLYSIGKKVSCKNVIKFSTPMDIKISSLISHLFGCYGFENFFSTNKLIYILKKIKPDIVHIHNIHSHDVNISRLFSFLNRNRIKVVWTFHDFFAITGYCVHFESTGCNKWKKSCGKCPQKKDYSFLFDCSKQNQFKKNQLLKNSNLTIVCPSEWMKKQIEESFLKDKRIVKISNGIDTSLFNNTGVKNDDGAKTILGVANIFTPKKGINDFIELAKRIDKRFNIVLIGEIDKKINLPKNIKHINQTNSPNKLAEYYKTSSVFVNMTYEDTYPTTNLEAFACGLPIITYEVGGSTEVFNFGAFGYSVEKGNIDKVIESIEKVCDIKPKNVNSNIVSKETMLENYYMLYKKL